MVKNALRIRFLSFGDVDNRSSSDIVLYVKKLVQVPVANASGLHLKETNRKSPLVRSLNETFDVFVDDEFCQVLFISPTMKHALGDYILKRSDLIDQYLNDPRYEKNASLELLRTELVAGKYTCQFSLRLLENGEKGKRLFRGHALKSTHFNQKVPCVICDTFTRGKLFQCSRCSLVAERECYPKIPFDCNMTPPLLNPVHSMTSSQDHPSVQHQFATYPVPLFQPIGSDERNYCDHCGSQVLQHALKCSHCASHVPPPPSSSPQFGDFTCFGRLGSGRYGEVYCVQYRPSKKCLAIKVVDGSNEEARQQFAFEQQMLLHHHHKNPYIIKGYCSFHRGSKLFLGMELADGGTLRYKIQLTHMNEEEIRFYLAELISVIQYLHSKRIIYRDLKLENIAIHSDGHIRLLDYGLGLILTHSEERRRTICGTPAYLAPEVWMLKGNVSSEGYNYSVDYWGLGMVFGQMLAGGQDKFDLRLSVNPNGEFDRQTIVDAIARLPPDISLEARAFLTGLLELDPTKRLGLPRSPHGSIRAHPLFTLRPGIEWDKIDEGMAKSWYSREPITSDTSTTMPFDSLSFDRSALAEGEWLAAGQASCSASEEEQWKSFDAVNDFAWSDME